MEEKKTLLFIFNPFSGKAQIKNQLMDIVDTMVKAGYEVTIYPTQAPEDAVKYLCLVNVDTGLSMRKRK